MSNINRGRPVFPQPQTYGEWADGSPWFEGLSLRDYFAAKVLQGQHSRDEFDLCLSQPEQRAKLAYIEADAMLRAREAT